MMQGNITVELDDLALSILPDMITRRIVDRIVDEWCKTEQFKKVLSQIQAEDFDVAELKKRVMDEIVCKVIKNWKESE